MLQLQVCYWLPPLLCLALEQWGRESGEKFLPHQTFQKRWYKKRKLVIHIWLILKMFFCLFSNLYKNWSGKKQMRKWAGWLFVPALCHVHSRVVALFWFALIWAALKGLSMHRNRSQKIRDKDRKLVLKQTVSLLLCWRQNLVLSF